MTIVEDSSVDHVCTPISQAWTLMQAHPDDLTLMSSRQTFPNNLQLARLENLQRNSSAKWLSTLALAHRIHHQSAASSSPQYKIGGQKPYDSLWHLADIFVGLLILVQLGETMIRSKPPCDDMIAVAMWCKQECQQWTYGEPEEADTREIHKHSGHNSNFLIVAAVIGFGEIIINIINNNMCRPGTM